MHTAGISLKSRFVVKLLAEGHTRSFLLRKTIVTNNGSGHKLIQRFIEKICGQAQRESGIILLA